MVQRRPTKRTRAEQVAYDACKLTPEQLMQPLQSLTTDGTSRVVKIRDALYSLDILKAKQLTRELEEELMTLLEANMRSLYERSAGGWNRREKLREMREPPSRILTLRKLDGGERKGDGGLPRASDSKHRKDGRRDAGELAGYCLFRLDTEGCDEEEPLKEEGEEDLEVIYCYELQISATHRGRGTGAFLMRSLELIGQATKMRRVMLTVFNHNHDALKFYALQGFAPDLISPPLSEEGEPTEDYSILSKALVEMQCQRKQGDQT